MNQHIEALKDTKLCPLWHDQDIKPEVLPSLQEDASCDLLVVGGGFTGLWGTLQAIERKPNTNIILIDQTFVGDGASGRCGGFISTSLAHGKTNTEYRFPGEAKRLDELGEQNMKELTETLERYQIDARYEQVGEMIVALDDESAIRMYDDYLKTKANGEDVVWFDKDAVRKQVNSPTFCAGIWYREGLDGVVDPARLCWGLKETLLNLGVRIFENTKLLGIEAIGPSSAKEGMKANCEFATIQSKKILMATNAFRSSIKKMRRSIIPIWDYQLATEPLTDAQMEKIGWFTSRHALADYNNMFHYFRITKDNRITWGGGGAVRYYFNNGIDKKHANVKSCYEQLAKEFFETFPQLNDVKFSHKWGGIIATSSRFCMVPGETYNGRVAWSVGYTGHGVGATRFGARIGIELLGYEPSDILDMQFVKKKALPWAPEPFRWLGVLLTQRALKKADANGGKRGLWLKLLDFLNLGFTC